MEHRGVSRPIAGSLQRETAIRRCRGSVVAARGEYYSGGRGESDLKIEAWYLKIALQRLTDQPMAACRVFEWTSSMYGDTSL